MEELRAIAAFVAGTSYDDIPPEVIERAKWVLRDTVGVIAAAQQESEVRQLADFAAEKHPGPATIIGHGGKTVPEWAALVHGTAGTTLELDEGHAFARGHAAIHCIPPALALAETRRTSGKEFLAMIVLGYEVAARAGVGTRLRKGVHPFGAWGVLGAAAVSARAAGMGAEAVAGVLEIAASYGITPSFETAYQGANVRNTYAGVVNRLGMLAVDLYPLGFRGEEGGLETAYGQILGDTFSPGSLVDGLGENYEIMRGYFKPYSGCRYTHAAVDAVLGIQAGADIDPDQIDSVTVETYDIAATLTNQAPKTPLAGRFSLPHVVAAALILKSNGPEAFRESALKDARLRALSSRIVVREDPEFTGMTPARRPARVSIRLKDGSHHQHMVTGSKGDPDQPMSPAELEDKFHNLMGKAYARSQISGMWEMIGQLDTSVSTDEFFSMMENKGGAIGEIR